MSALDCRPGRRHRFGSISGYCLHGCGVRDDGRVVSRGGAVIYPGPCEPRREQPTLDGFEDYLQRMSE